MLPFLYKILFFLSNCLFACLVFYVAINSFPNSVTNPLSMANTWGTLTSVYFLGTWPPPLCSPQMAPGVSLGLDAPRPLPLCPPPGPSHALAEPTL